MLKRPHLPHPRPQDDMELMEANLLALQREITERSEEDDEPLSSSHLRASSRTQHPQTLPSLIRLRYEEYLQARRLPQNHEEKINFLLEEGMSVGNAVALFEMLHYFKEALAEEILTEIAGKVFEAFVQAHNQEEMVCFGEVLAQCGIESEEVCQHVAELMVEERVPLELGLVVLSNQGETGLVYLFDLANRDLPSISHRVLDALSRTDAIISQLLVPLLIQDLFSQAHPKYKDVALCVLNRLGPAISDPITIQQIGDLLADSSIDKRILMATLRSLGAQGERLLLEVVSSRHYSESMVALALSVLSWRVPSRPVLRMKAIEFTIQNCFLPGRLYQYEGQVEPWNFQTEPCTDSLCLSARDFLAQMEVFLKEGAFRRQSGVNNRELFVLEQVLGLQEEGGVQISQEVVRALGQELRNKSLKIREVALLELGNIGLPQGESAVEAVGRCLWDQDSSIRSAACWTLSRISPEVPRKIETRLCQLLRDHFWKVRTSACMALGLTTRRPQNSTVEQLLRNLQDGSIPKATVCQSLARMGAEELLLEILKGSSKGDFKLREAIISSFEFSNLRSPLVNLIVEELLRYSRDARIETRELCLLSLNSLRSRVEARGGESISYFQTKNLLPFYYCFLDDAAPRIRTIAAEGILSFGAQAELIFIQGMTKGLPLAKIECIKCLGRLGVQNFRALVLGLRDEDERVKRAASATILGYFTPEDIVEEFKDRENHAISLVCNLTEILRTSLKSEELKSFLRDVIAGLNEGRKSGVGMGVIKNINQNTRLN